MNSMINLWYGKRKGKYVVVKKEVLPLDPESNEPCSDDLSDFDLRIYDRPAFTSQPALKQWFDLIVNLPVKNRTNQELNQSCPL